MGDKPEKIDAPPSSHNVAKVAQEGFGSNAAAYDENRPSYTDEVVNLVLDEVVLSKSVIDSNALKYEILELGAGTGKLTELLAPKIPSGYRYMATEPSLNFLDHLKSKGLPVETNCTSASSIPLPDNSVQNVVCAQCLHWFSNEESLKEIHRVLVPEGKLIAVWNVKKFEEGKWTNEMYKQRLELMKRSNGSMMHWVNTMEWKKGVEASGLFTQVTEELLDGIECDSNLDDTLKHLSTVSFYNILPEDERNMYLDSLRQAILSYSDIDPNNLCVPFNSLVFVAFANLD